MRRALPLAALLWVLHTLSVYADPIRITGGSFDILNRFSSGSERFGVLNIESFDGFRLVTFTAVASFGACFPCAPGESLNLGGIAHGSSFETLEGGPVPPNPPWQPPFPGWGFLFEAGNVPVPPLGTSAVLTAPFVFTGTLTFVHTDLAHFPPTQSFELFGRGTGTVELRPDPNGAPVWSFARARYEFAPVPEPPTLVLVSSGLAAGAWRGRRKHQR